MLVNKQNQERQILLIFFFLVNIIPVLHTIDGRLYSHTQSLCI